MADEIEYDDCPDCEGAGSAMIEVDYPEPGHRVEIYDDCLTCGGTGETPA